MSKGLKIFFGFIFGLFVVGLYFFTFRAENSKEQFVLENIAPAPAIQNPEKEEDPKIKSEDVPDKVMLDVPFTSQAPYGIWDAYHKEACEEASLVMVKSFLDKKALTIAEADKQIRSMIDFEIKRYGKYEDTNMEENIKLFHDFYGSSVNNVNLQVVYDFQKDDIKKYLAQGNPIILPAAGRRLGNPYYTPPGPLYHNVVLIGYEKDGIITNDPGTRRGQGYKYDVDVLFDAAHDFTGNVGDIEKGRKAMIVIENK